MLEHLSSMLKAPDLVQGGGTGEGKGECEGEKKEKKKRANNTNIKNMKKITTLGIRWPLVTS